MTQHTEQQTQLINELLEALYDDTTLMIDFLVNCFHLDSDEINEMGCEEIFENLESEISEYSFEEIKAFVEKFEEMGFEIDGFDSSKMILNAKSGKMRQPCKEPCPSCPYTKNAPKGYFGGQDPLEYANAIGQDTVVACHTHTKHSEESGVIESDSDITICTGHIISQIKTCKSSIHPEGQEAHALVRSRDNFEELKDNALGFDFKSHHGIA